MDIVFLSDAVMARESFEQLPIVAGDAARIAEAVKRLHGRLCRAVIERDGSTAWHALAWLSINGLERVAAARVKLGRYQSED